MGKTCDSGKPSRRLFYARIEIIFWGRNMIILIGRVGSVYLFSSKAWTCLESIWRSLTLTFSSYSWWRDIKFGGVYWVSRHSISGNLYIHSFIHFFIIHPFIYLFNHYYSSFRIFILSFFILSFIHLTIIIDLFIYSFYHYS